MQGLVGYCERVDTNLPIKLKVGWVYTIVEPLPYLEKIFKWDEIKIISIDGEFVTLIINWVNEKVVSIPNLQLALWYTWPFLTITWDIALKANKVISKR